MAYCPKCQSEIPAMARICDHCGYDFPSSVGREVQRGWAYGPFGSGAIAVSIVICQLYVVGGVIATGVCLYQKSYLPALLGILGSVAALGFVAALSRIQDLS